MLWVSHGQPRAVELWKQTIEHSPWHRRRDSNQERETNVVVPFENGQRSARPNRYTNRHPTTKGSLIQLRRLLLS
jgi:hypothetical protein